ncbi:MAG TPA: hypothetical protein VGX23_20870 [Actinocrinis sp.]|nr:hypothetical protein [Actinocrinis sp.]
MTPATPRQHGRHSRYRYPALAALALAAALAPSAAFATTPVQDPLPIGPNQSFVGVVNGKAANAVITMVCPGPITPGETGHPLAGQYVEVETVVPVAAADGFTGSSATHIDANFATPSAASVNPPVVFTSYFVKEAIPTTDVFPCSGSGAVTFVPLPTSTTARSFTVSVAFADVATGG